MPGHVPELFFSDVDFPEGPRWRDGKLWVSDILGGKVRAIDASGTAEVIAELHRPSGLGWLPDGRMLVVSMVRKKLMRLDPEGLIAIAGFESLIGGSVNDMVVDPQGRAYVGGTQGRDAPPGSGKVLLVTPEGEVRVAADGLEGPNGPAITPDGKTFIIAETRAGRLTAFTIRADGSLTECRLFAQLDNAMPDGICLDAEGAVWVGDYPNSQFLRVREGGEIADRIPTPGRWSVACMLGGQDRRTLYLMTAVTTMEDFMGRGIADGRIERVRVDVPGAGLP